MPGFYSPTGRVIERENHFTPHSKKNHINLVQRETSLWRESERDTLSER